MLMTNNCSQPTVLRLSILSQHILLCSSEPQNTAMSGVGEGLLLNLAAELIVKAAELGFHILQDTRNYAKEGEDFKMRMETQMAIWRAIGEKLKKEEIKRRIRKCDLEIYYKIEKKLYRLLYKYVQRHCRNNAKLTEALEKLTIQDKIQELQESGILEDIDAEEEGPLEFFYRSKRQIAWTLRKEGKDRKLIKEAEEWSSRLQQLTSWTIPSMFPHATVEQVAVYIVDPSGSLTDTNLKGKIILSMAGSNITVGGLKVIKEAEEGPFKLTSKRVKFLPRGFVTPRADGEFSIDPKADSDEIKNQLGGNVNRQWANFTAEDGKNPATVIVEFKMRPPTSEPSTDNPSSSNRSSAVVPVVPHDNPDNLVRTLRLAAHDPHFHVLHCEGWCDVGDKYGLVYRLPAMRNDFICETLTNILLKPEYRDLLHSDLENRLNLARALARSLLELHVVDWVHESFFPDNIILFGEKVGGKWKFDWTKPYLVGFGSSRPNAETSSYYNFKLQWSYRLHNHPDRNDCDKHNPYKKLYDIYSLGVVLLELGRGSSVMEDPKKPENAKWSINVGAQKLKENLIQEAMSLPIVLGHTFRGIVLTCLNEELKAADYEGQLTHEFKAQVCDKLEQIKINV